MASGELGCGAVHRPAGRDFHQNTPVAATNNLATRDTEEHFRTVSRAGKAWLKEQQILDEFFVEKMAATVYSVKTLCKKCFHYL